jgi:membrane protein implicated in regulation of membrane protease activity
VVVEDVAPEGKVRFKNELWAATSSGKRFFKGERVRINGLQGLKLIVGETTEVRGEGSCGSIAGE